MLEAFLLGVSLAMDALAVSLALGTAERKNFTAGKILLTAGAFGLFQFLMPLTGWFCGGLCGSLIQLYGRIIASVLLLFLGGKMIREAWKSGGDDEDEVRGFGFLRLIVLAFATSIDALLVGISYACLGRCSVSVVRDTIIIGAVTFLISSGGCILGRSFGNIFGNRCEIFGGLVLIGIGCKILLIG